MSTVAETLLLCLQGCGCGCLPPECRTWPCQLCSKSSLAERPGSCSSQLWMFRHNKRSVRHDKRSSQLNRQTYFDKLFLSILISFLLYINRLLQRTSDCTLFIVTIITSPRHWWYCDYQSRHKGALCYSEFSPTFRLPKLTHIQYRTQRSKKTMLSEESEWSTAMVDKIMDYLLIMAMSELKLPMLKHSRATSMKNSRIRARCFFFTGCETDDKKRLNLFGLHKKDKK